MTLPAHSKENHHMLQYREKAESLARTITDSWRVDDAQDVKALTDAVRNALVEEANLELRQIFAQLGGTMDLALMRQRRGEPPLSEQKLTALIEGVERASTILDLFLDPASAAKLTIQLEPTRFDLGEGMRKFIQLHGLEGKVEAALEPSHVDADEGKLVDALGHLVTRFYFASRRHEKVIITLQCKDGHAEGFIGLTPSHFGLAQLMEEIRIPMNVEDIGIEVSYLRAIIERHGGTLFVATAGESSTGFGFSIPLAGEEAA